MSKLSDSKILELALNSSDPMIRRMVDKLIFAIKLKHTEEHLLNAYDNYAFHHGIEIHMPTTGEDMSIAVHWKHDDFRIVSFEHMLVTGKTGDLVSGEDTAKVYMTWDQNFKA